MHTLYGTTFSDENVSDVLGVARTMLECFEGC